MADFHCLHFLGTLTFTHCKTHHGKNRLNRTVKLDKDNLQQIFLRFFHYHLSCDQFQLLVCNPLGNWHRTFQASQHNLLIGWALGKLIGHTASIQTWACFVHSCVLGSSGTLYLKWSPGFLQAPGHDPRQYQKHPANDSWHHWACCTTGKK